MKKREVVFAVFISVFFLVFFILTIFEVFFFPKMIDFFSEASINAQGLALKSEIFKIDWYDRGVVFDNKESEISFIKKPARLSEKMEEIRMRKISIGFFNLTAYCSCEMCCGEFANNRPTDENGNEVVYGAIGERLIPGYSIAVDPTVIPYGTKVEIDGRIYCAQDCGGGIKNNSIDVYFSNHQDALNFGVQQKEIFVIMEGRNVFLHNIGERSKIHF